LKHIVRVKPNFDFGEALKVIARFGTVYLTVPEIFMVGLDANEAAIAQLKTYIAVQSITPDESLSASFTPNDPSWAGAWFAPAMGLEQAWDISTGVGVKIAVLDTGVNTTHVDLKNKLLPGWCVVTNTATVTQVYSHGTQTTSIAVGEGNNSAGAVGVAHGSMGIPIRITTQADGKTTDLYIAAGIVKAVEMGANVVSISFGAPFTGFGFLQAAKYARQNGVVVVGAMSNTLTEMNVDMSAAQDAIYVGAVNSSFTRSYGAGNVMLVRGPEGIPAATGTGSSYANFGGNSAATPVIAGVCALILSIRPDLGLADLREIIAMSANKTIIRNSQPSYTTIDGHGFVNALEALRLAQKWVPIGSGSPRVMITKPRVNETLFVENAVDVEVVASDDVAVSRVDLFLGSTKVGTSYSAPFVFSVDVLSIGFSGGLNKLKAIAYDNLGQDSVSAEIDIRLAYGTDTTDTSASEFMIPSELTEGAEYELRARFVSLAGAGEWSEWITYTVPDTTPAQITEYWIEEQGDNKLIHYVHPHAGQRLEYRLTGGEWQTVTSNPFVLPEFQGVADLDFRMATSTATSAPTSVGTFNFTRLYYVVYPAELFDPSASQIMLGNNSLDQPAVASGSEEALTSTGLQTLESYASGLAPGTPYRIAFVGTNGVGLSNVAVSDPWQTLPDGTIVRALVVENGQLAELPAGQENSGRKPVVVYQGTLKERVWSEGDIVVVADDGTLRGVADHETLVI
jgi:hypothetical protein